MLLFLLQEKSLSILFLVLWRRRVPAVSRQCSLTSLLVFAWLQSGAGREGGSAGGRTEPVVKGSQSWYSNISPSLFSLFTIFYLPPVKLVIYCQTAETSAKGILTIKSCEVLSRSEPRLLHFKRKIFVTGRVVEWEEKWEVRECKYFPRQHWDLWEGRNDLQNWTRRYTTRHWAELSLSNVSDWWKNLKSILFSVLWVFILEWLKRRTKIY